MRSPTTNPESGEASHRTVPATPALRAVVATSFSTRALLGHVCDNSTSHIGLDGVDGLPVPSLREILKSGGVVRLYFLQWDLPECGRDVLPTDILTAAYRQRVNSKGGRGCLAGAATGNQDHLAVKNELLLQSNRVNGGHNVLSDSVQMPFVVIK